MPKFDVTVQYFRKPACLNPEESVTKSALHSLGFTTVEAIKMGGCLVITVGDAPDTEAARQTAIAASEKLLVNLVTSQYRIESVVAV